MPRNQYLLIPFLVGWTSIYQLFWCSPGVQGFDTLPYVFVGIIPINIFNDGDSGIESTIIDDYVENSKGVFSLILCICWCHSPCWKLLFLAFAGFQPPLCCGCVRPYMIPSGNSTYGQSTDKKEQTLEVFWAIQSYVTNHQRGITIKLQISQMPTFYP